MTTFNLKELELIGQLIAFYGLRTMNEDHLALARKVYDATVQERIRNAVADSADAVQKTLAAIVAREGS